MPPEGRRGRGARSAPLGKAAGCSAPARGRGRSRAAGSPAGDYMAPARSPVPAAKLAAARAHGPVGVSARGDMPAGVRAPRRTVLPRCAPAAGTAASPANLPAGPRGAGRRAAGEANGRAGAPGGGGCGARAARASGSGAGPRRRRRGPAGAPGPVGSRGPRLLGEARASRVRAEGWGSELSAGVAGGPRNATGRWPRRRRDLGELDFV